MNVLFCGNDKVFDGMLTVMLSIFKRTASKAPINFYIFTMDVSHLKSAYLPLSDEQANYLSEVAKTYNENHQVTKIDVTNLYMQTFSQCPNENAYCSPYTLIRLLADKVEAIPDKILYLDIDIMFNRDITLLYDIDINDYEYAAARDHYGKVLVHPNYVNAGVLLLNMKKIRETGLFRKACKLLQEKKLVFADQSALIRSTTKKKMLSQRFNDQKFLHKKTIIRHFSKRLFYLPYPHTDNIKQWHVQKVHKVFKYYQFDDIYEDYFYYKKIFEMKKGAL